MRCAFTLIELITVIIILAVLAAAAMPVYFDQADRARQAADHASIAAIQTALDLAYYQHRLKNAPSSQWITDLTEVATAMESGQLPAGITIDGAALVDQRGNRYKFAAETLSSPANLTLPSSGGAS